MTTPHIGQLTAGAEQLSLPQQSSSEVTSPESRKQQGPQPDVVFVEPPVIVWRILMLEQQETGCMKGVRAWLAPTIANTDSLSEGGRIG
jgi:hypothetical protein